MKLRKESVELPAPAHFAGEEKGRAALRCRKERLAPRLAQSNVDNKAPQREMACKEGDEPSFEEGGRRMDSPAPESPLCFDSNSWGAQSSSVIVDKDESCRELPSAGFAAQCTAWTMASSPVLVPRSEEDASMLLPPSATTVQCVCGVVMEYASPKAHCCQLRSSEVPKISPPSSASERCLAQSACTAKPLCSAPTGTGTRAATC
mmetsp:Transcript_74466/g.167063  ORF Transcript_74466/g.167063 Transcript_74466/m.167063 type:complete len:205 (-) Transcript_74466:54-668(-)